MLELVREQGELIERQERTIRVLEERLGKIASLALSSHNRLEELDERAPDAEVATAVQERLAELESSIEELPERPNIVSAGEFPGPSASRGRMRRSRSGARSGSRLSIPWTPFGSEDRFITSSIPIEGTEEAGKESQARLHRPVRAA